MKVQRNLLFNLKGNNGMGSKTKNQIISFALIIIFIFSSFQCSVKAEAARTINRLLINKKGVSQLPTTQVIQAFDLYKQGSNIYLFTIQQGDGEGTPILSLHKLVNGIFEYQSKISLVKGGHGDSLAVEGNHIWITGTRTNTDDGTEVPVIRRLTFVFGDAGGGKEKINVTSEKMIKNLIYGVIDESVTYKNLKKAFVAVTGTRLCIKISFKNIKGKTSDDGYYRVYDLLDMNRALDKMSGSELKLDKDPVGNDARLATFHWYIEKLQGMEIDDTYLYASRGGLYSIPIATKLKYSTKTKGSKEALKMQEMKDIDIVFHVELYRDKNDIGENIEAEGFQRLQSDMGEFKAGGYILPGEMDVKINKKANLYYSSDISIK